MPFRCHIAMISILGSVLLHQVPPVSSAFQVNQPKHLLPGLLPPEAPETPALEPLSRILPESLLPFPLKKQRTLFS